jgi:uncharacterized membrane protein YgcG
MVNVVEAFPSVDPLAVMLLYILLPPIFALIMIWLVWKRYKWRGGFGKKLISNLGVVLNHYAPLVTIINVCLATLLFINQGAIVMNKIAVTGDMKYYLNVNRPEFVNYATIFNAQALNSIRAIRQGVHLPSARRALYTASPHASYGKPTDIMNFVYHLGDFGDILSENNLVNVCRTERNLIQNLPCLGLEEYESYAFRSFIAKQFNTSTCEFLTSYEDTRSKIGYSPYSNFFYDRAMYSDTHSPVLISYLRLGTCGQDYTTNEFVNLVNDYGVGGTRVVVASYHHFKTQLLNETDNMATVMFYSTLLAFIFLVLSVRGVVVAVATIGCVVLSLTCAAAMVTHYNFVGFSVFNSVALIVLLSVGAGFVHLYGAAWRHTVKRGTNASPQCLIDIFGAVGTGNLITFFACCLAFYSISTSPLVFLSQMGYVLGTAMIVFFFSFHYIIVPLWVWTSWYVLPRSFHNALRVCRQKYCFVCLITKHKHHRHHLTAAGSEAEPGVPLDRVADRNSLTRDARENRYSRTIEGYNSRSRSRSSSSGSDSGSGSYSSYSDSNSDSSVSDRGARPQRGRGAGAGAGVSANRKPASAAVAAVVPVDQVRFAPAAAGDRSQLVEAVAAVAWEEDTVGPEGDGGDNGGYEEAPDVEDGGATRRAGGGGGNGGGGGGSSGNQQTPHAIGAAAYNQPDDPPTNDEEAATRTTSWWSYICTLRGKRPLKFFGLIMIGVTVFLILLTAFLSKGIMTTDFGASKLIDSPGNLADAMTVFRYFRSDIFMAVDDENAATIELFGSPTRAPTRVPTARPSVFHNPSASPTFKPTVSSKPTVGPTMEPSMLPTPSPTASSGDFIPPNEYMDYRVMGCWGLTTRRRHVDTAEEPNFHYYSFKDYMIGDNTASSSGAGGLLDDMVSICDYVESERSYLNVHPEWNRTRDCISNQFYAMKDSSYFNSYNISQKTVANVLTAWGLTYDTATTLVGLYSNETSQSTIPVWVCANFSARTYVPSFHSKKSMGVEMRSRWENAFAEHGSTNANRFGVNTMVASSVFTWQLFGLYMTSQVYYVAIVFIIGFFLLLLVFTKIDFGLTFFGMLGMLCIYFITIFLGVNNISKVLDLSDIVALIVVVPFMVGFTSYLIMEYITNRIIYERKKKSAARRNKNKFYSLALRKTQRYMLKALTGPLIFAILVCLPFAQSSLPPLRRVAQYYMICSVVAYLYVVFVQPYMLAFACKSSVCTFTFFEEEDDEEEERNAPPPSEFHNSIEMVPMEEHQLQMQQQQEYGHADEQLLYSDGRRVGGAGRRGGGSSVASSTDGLVPQQYMGRSQYIVAPPGYGGADPEFDEYGRPLQMQPVQLMAPQPQPQTVYVQAPPPPQIVYAGHQPLQQTRSMYVPAPQLVPMQASQSMYIPAQPQRPQAGYPQLQPMQVMLPAQPQPQQQQQYYYPQQQLPVYNEQEEEEEEYYDEDEEYADENTQGGGGGGEDDYYSSPYRQTFLPPQPPQQQHQHHLQQPTPSFYSNGRGSTVPQRIPSAQSMSSQNTRFTEASSGYSSAGPRGRPVAANAMRPTAPANNQQQHRPLAQSQLASQYNRSAALQPRPARAPAANTQYRQHAQQSLAEDSEDYE